jgi:hypothetical protein
LSIDATDLLRCRWCDCSCDVHLCSLSCCCSGGATAFVTFMCVIWTLRAQKSHDLYATPFLQGIFYSLTVTEASALPISGLCAHQSHDLYATPFICNSRAFVTPSPSPRRRHCLFQRCVLAAVTTRARGGALQMDARAPAANAFVTTVHLGRCCRVVTLCVLLRCCFQRVCYDGSLG